MCKRITCQKCNKPSYAGCGAHIEQVLGDIPKDQRCKCQAIEDKDESVLSYKVVL